MESKMSRSYWGFYFIFEDEDVRDRFLKLYSDIIVNYDILKSNPKAVKIQLKKGGINEIRNSFNKGDITTKKRINYVKLMPIIS